MLLKTKPTPLTRLQANSLYLRQDQNLADLDNVILARAALGLEIGVDVQAWDADLDTIAGLAKTDGNFIVGDGVNWTVESGATVRSSLGLGTIATQNANNVTISGGSITGITDLAIADGGTGQSTAQLAINALSNVAGATNEHVLTKDPATGNAIFMAAAGGSSLPVADTQTIVMGSADNTKLLRFEIDGFSAGATRVMTPPNQDTTLAGQNFANVFTAAQTQQGSGIQTLTIRSTDNQAQLNVVSQQAGGGDWLFGTGASGALGVDAFFLYSQIAPAGFYLEIDKSGQVYIPGSLTVKNATLPANAVIYAGGAGGAANRIGVNHDSNTGFGFYISDVQKWAAAAYKPSGTNFSFVFYNAQDDVNSFYIDGGTDNSIFGVPFTGGSLLTYARLNAYTYDASTVTIVNEIAMIADSSGTPAAGFGAGLRAILKSSTTIGQDAGRLTYEWATATHASRKALSKWTVFDTAEREAIRIEASGTAPMLGFYGTAAVAVQTVTGSRGGNAALADLLTKLATLGLIIDGSS